MMECDCSYKVKEFEDSGIVADMSKLQMSTNQENPNIMIENVY